tara:strand:- start:8 stop:403 length:396 start_codon:yes stop_codon:yes gene_type:complete
MRRVYSDIVGDLFHIGHINMFKQAREYGDYLIVGVHSDKTVESYKRKPIICENDRYEIIRNCKLVDEVIIDAPLVITHDYINKNKIDIVVHGDDNLFSENYKVPIEMQIMKYVPYTKGVSTSEIIRRIENG